MSNISEDQKKLMNQMEEMLIETFNTCSLVEAMLKCLLDQENAWSRMKRVCSEKCTAVKYENTDLIKNEAVCLDRCVAKYMELHDTIGRRLSKDKATYDLLANPPYETNPMNTEAYKLKSEADKLQS